VATDLKLALDMAELADSITSAHFAATVIAVEAKPDGTPVTVADREVEEALRDLVRKYRPMDGFLGEEVGSSTGRSRRWIVDGIDGTHNFANHRPQWGTLIGLETNGEVVVGVASAPAAGQRWWASRGGGAWTAPLGKAKSSAPQRLRVSQVENLLDARVVVMPPAELVALRTGWRGRVAERIEAVTTRSGESPVNGHVPLLVAEGRLDLSVHLWGGPWDHAALVVIVEEAGGCFTDLWGGRRLDTETAVYSNRPLGDELLTLLVGLIGPPPLA
jgi:histidinol-phosphatase